MRKTILILAISLLTACGGGGGGSPSVVDAPSDYIPPNIPTGTVTVAVTELSQPHKISPLPGGAPAAGGVRIVITNSKNSQVRIEDFDVVNGAISGGTPTLKLPVGVGYKATAITFVRYGTIRKLLKYGLSESSFDILEGQNSSATIATLQGLNVGITFTNWTALTPQHRTFANWTSRIVSSVANSKPETDPFAFYNISASGFGSAPLRRSWGYAVKTGSSSFSNYSVYAQFTNPYHRKIKTPSGITGITRIYPLGEFYLDPVYLKVTDNFRHWSYTSPNQSWGETEISMRINLRAPFLNIIGGF